METITAALCRTLLPRRSRDGHKGTFGKVAVVGGAVGYTGAPVYAGEAAARTGSGLVFAGVPEAEFAEAVEPSDSVPSVWGAFAASMESWGFSASSPCGAAGLAAMEAAAA